ncbi:YjbH domain-containing protein [Sodalis-like endosymbiont of Proechinophthirus fluctus]|uniref:YjbH domain-containing protein n=1 Tax=Sodalis-like endosymbiont of Proechinophthirus fluctus TaxID=1462730 RepID=UPI002110523F|nr:YjbH domain-containing protein [Sodalis-like endosymbiont of Proechinophthirus fluctus]
MPTPPSLPSPRYRKEEYSERSFTKDFYLSIPLDVLTITPNRIEHSSTGSCLPATVVRWWDANTICMV